MACQVCGKPAAPQPGVDRRFCGLAHQQHFEREQDRAGLNSLLTRLQQDDRASRVEAVARTVSMIGRTTLGDCPSPARILLPMPMAREICWPSGTGIALAPAGFDPCLAPSTLIVEVAAPTPMNPDEVPALRPPAPLESRVAFDPVEFLGPPPRLPAFVNFPLRYRYFGELAPAAGPAPAGAPAVAVLEPEPVVPVQTPSALADVLANMVTLLKGGKQCK